jgi:hypothetical protein
MTVDLESGAIWNQFGASLNAVAARRTGRTSTCRPHMKGCNEERPHPPPPGGFHCIGGPHKLPPPESILSLIKFMFLSLEFWPFSHWICERGSNNSRNGLQTCVFDFSYKSMLFSCACVKSEAHKTDGNKASTFSLDIDGIASFVIGRERDFKQGNLMTPYDVIRRNYTYLECLKSL